MLLELDNFEHVLPAALPLAQLLTACPRLKVLITRRTRLHVSAEQEFPITPLALPQDGSAIPLKEMTHSIQLALRRQGSYPYRPVGPARSILELS